MTWIAEVFRSEFLWGTVLGILLSIVTARATLYFQSCAQEKTVRRFADDLIYNICDYVNALEENRDRSKVIFVDILALVENEIGVWGRNREQLIHVRQDSDRRAVRDFFARTAQLVVEIKFQIQRFSDLNTQAINAGEDEDGSNRQRAISELAIAHQRCDKLVAHVRSSTPVLTARRS